MKEVLVVCQHTVLNLRLVLLSALPMECNRTLVPEGRLGQCKETPLHTPDPSIRRQPIQRRRRLSVRLHIIHTIENEDRKNGNCLWARPRPFFPKSNDGTAVLQS
jgi:hypothetical protein